jgi:hypothetical protein
MKVLNALDAERAELLQIAPPVFSLGLFNLVRIACVGAPALRSSSIPSAGSDELIGYEGAKPLEYKRSLKAIVFRVG